MFKRLVISVLGVAAMSAAPSIATATAGTATFSGVVTDDNCENGDHSHMKMGDTDAECTNACVNSHGSRYILFDGKTPYILSDLKTLETFAGQRVTVEGVLDAKTRTITITSIVRR